MFFSSGEIFALYRKSDRGDIPPFRRKFIDDTFREAEHLLMIQLDHHIADLIVRGEERILLTVSVRRLYEETEFRKQPEGFRRLLRSDLPHQVTRDPFGSRIEILKRHHFKDRAVIPFLEYTELRRFHLVQTGAGARLDELGVIEMLFLVRLRLIEKHEIFKISGAFLDKS